MKGISHFVSGVAVSSFFPWTVLAGAEGHPLYFVLGGVFGILPDTFDFKFYRFFYKHDVHVEPDGTNPDPQLIADAIAGAVQRAVDEGRAIRLKLSTIRVGADYWQQYIVRFDEQRQEVQVRFGPVVNTGQVPIVGAPKSERPIGRAALPCPVVQTYEATTRVDIFDGPTFAIEPDRQGRVLLHFLPWHRNWSHSLVVGLILGAIGSLIGDWRAGVVIAAAYAIHILEDQLGHMGSNLFFPLTLKGRSAGLKWMHSGDSLPNFATVWTCCLLIFWNLYRYNPNPEYVFSFWQLLWYGAVLPMSVYGAAYWILKRTGEADEPIELSDEWGDDPLLS